MAVYLLKLGELTLKGGNRREFERILRRNLAQRLRGTGASIQTTAGRFYVTCDESAEIPVETVLDRLFGIAGWAKTRDCKKIPQAVFDACIEEAALLRENGLRTFKVEARRTDKGFPLNSYEIRSEAGSLILEQFPGLTVDVHSPDAVIQVEIREKAYIYSMARKGQRGLPVGTAGRGLLLLSGGIDSPVAGYMMAGRGMHIDAVYFHAYPYTSDEARQKVVSLAETVGAYTMGIRLHTVGFTAVQMRIKERAPMEWTTVLLRMAMMECAQRIAFRRKAKCLITGESLSQVASQTVENISCTQSRITLPVLRPLIGIEKDDIIRTAKRIGTYDTSILPYEDCCVLFSPPHPIIRGEPAEANRIYESLELADLMDEAVRETTEEKCAFPE
ncbi:tRNA uracil 4-sulfurtransferase ThiI [Breznakiella homolactica]|uniref:Probable tRNA sulfurtransferase n=1 Tax=Breznakiella homolactica TaxID=2798577 RepID=A0A7T7XKG4_9SPIR|nr:tRNA uracil 4-sulfurtransferase ThiI [Breznakiella homolactica]QQO08006.1 tRNA 4-thiouridine(8) synthase ThiI [Breznakiella homolactica]